MLKRILFSILAVSGFLEGMTNVKELSIEDKVGQLLIVHFNGEDANSQARQLIEEAHVGGFIYYNWSNGLKSPEQVQRLSNGLQRMADRHPHHIPLFISIDQEGGPVNRLSNGFTAFPGNRALARTGSIEYARNCAYATGLELRAVGINMNLAPVVDVDSAKLPVIGIRAFSKDPQEVVEYGKIMLQGFKQSSVIATLKHFPGYGDVTIDPHDGLPTVYKTRRELDNCELVPFRALSKQADAIMSAHIMLPAIDSKHCATLSPIIIQGILRKEFGYKGIIMSDSLIMRGVTDSCADIAEAAIQAVLAGHDILVLGGKLLDQPGQTELTVPEILVIHQKLCEAVRIGRISEEALNASVKRILDLKKNYQLHNFYPTPKDIAQKVNTTEHQFLAREVAEKALQVIRNNLKKPINWQKTKVAVVAPEILHEAIEQSVPAQAKFVFFAGLDPIESEKEIQELVEWADVVLFFSYEAWKNLSQIDAIKQIEKKKSLVVIVTRNPEDVNVIPGNASIIVTYSPVAVSLRAAVEALNKKEMN
jgi:beta-N-acetylhexosaminidase